MEAHVGGDVHDGIIREPTEHVSAYTSNGMHCVSAGISMRLQDTEHCFMVVTPMVHSVIANGD